MCFSVRATFDVGDEDAAQSPHRIVRGPATAAPDIGTTVVLCAVYGSLQYCLVQLVNGVTYTVIPSLVLCLSRQVRTALRNSIHYSLICGVPYK